MTSRGIALLAATAIWMINPKPAFAEGSPDIGALQRQVDDLTVREARALDRVEQLSRRVESLERGRLSDAEQSLLRGKAAQSTLTAMRFGDTIAAMNVEASDGGSVAPNLPTDAQADRKSPAPTEAVEEVARQQLGHVGDRFGLELGMAYSHFDNARVNLNGFLALDAIFLGRISIQQVKADILTADLTARYGLTDRLQFDVDVPYLYRRSNFQSGGAGGAASGLAEKTVTDDGFGDVSAGINYRLFAERGSRPDVVLNARVKAPTGRNAFGTELIEVPETEHNLAVPARLPTGSGVWGSSVGVSALKTIDPLVVFGSLTYFHNFKKHFADLDEAVGLQPGTAELGDAIQFGVGAAFALNDKSSLSMSYTERLVGHSRLRLDGHPFKTVVGSEANVALVNLGGTFALSPRATLITTVGIGLTQDSPNLVFSLRLPYRF